jgi:glucose-1-phosphate adenylyltransferase
MGIYVFTAEKLYKYLELDNAKVDTENDFGKNILPTMLADGEKMVAYRFNGYWKDVGTIQSLYDANMDLLGDVPKIDVTDKKWIIQSRSPLAPPHYIGEGAKTVNSIIMSGCEIYGIVENSVLASDVVVKKGAVVKNSIIMSNAQIGENCKIEYSIIDEDVKIGNNSQIGEEKSTGKGITVIGRNVKISNGVKIGGGEMIDKNVKGEDK